MENTTNITNNIYHYIPECNYNPGHDQFTFEAVFFLSTYRCLQVYGTDRVILLEDVIERVAEEADRLKAIECPSHLYCGADDAWYERMDCRIGACYSLIDDLQKGEKQLTTTQAGVLYRLFPELQKGIMIEAARREVQYATMHRYYCDVMQMDTNMYAAMKILKDLTLVDDERYMDGLPETGDQYDALEVRKHISFKKSVQAYENLQAAMENLFRFHVERDDHRNINW